ncbi:hypothetical protein MKZ38_008115 [Zalerion maritima]|uniref:Ammonium transporter n=1 Tax=Zalerion maritima TaxID=339359 RepID=A0AAD5RW68_9PEZI|nr:hypothetical protein MKZ38_008115 [Zalerion maritima]
MADAELSPEAQAAADFAETLNSGDIAWIITSSALVLLMIPGVGFFYSGLARRKSALSLLFLCMMSVAVVGFEWFFWGYSLAFASDASAFIGTLKHFGLMDVMRSDEYAPMTTLFILFQGMFAAITPALAIGAAADRARILPAIVFIFVWSTIVYNPIACWTWNGNGWSAVMGGLDFAGGTPVHISSGTAALAYSLMLGKRTGYNKTNGLPYRPHNVTHVVLGTVFLWVGWFGFNGGSELAANERAAMTCLVTHIAACMGAITWCLLDLRLDNKYSVIGFCSGAISGLVAITPGSGFVSPWAAVIFGIVGGIVCNFATKLKFLIGVDDALDIFAVHGIGGFAGNLLTGLFADSNIASLNGSEVDPLGWVDGHYIQLAYQLADSCAGMAYSFVLTCLILFLMNLVPGLSLRASKSDEDEGLDDTQLGEFAYDYVEISRHLADYTHSEHSDENAAEKGTAVSPTKTD